MHPFKVVDQHLDICVYARREDEAAKQVVLLLQPLGIVPAYARPAKECKLHIENITTSLNVDYRLYTATQTVKVGTDYKLITCIIPISFSVHHPFRSLLQDEIDNDNNQSITGNIHTLQHIDDPVLDTLRTVLNLPSFRLCQRDIIDSFMKGKDTIAIMPTGAGKTVCFLVPAMLSSGVTFVIVPFNALMYDLWDKCIKLGIPTKCINQHIEELEFQLVCHDLHTDNPQLKVIITTPESLQKDDIKAALHKLNDNGKLHAVVIDEIHCMSRSSHQFRPEYKMLGHLKKRA